jgi:HTH-type transcriptional regulator / antitoxin HipB
MQYPHTDTYAVDTPQQLRTILRSLRQASGLTQAQLGARLGVTQKRIARIEAAPEVTAYDQIARMVTAMGYRLLIEKPAPQHQVAEPGPDTW